MPGILSQDVLKDAFGLVVAVAITQDVCHLATECRVAAMRRQRSHELRFGLDISIGFEQDSDVLGSLLRSRVERVRRRERRYGVVPSVRSHTCRAEQRPRYVVAVVVPD